MPESYKIFNHINESQTMLNAIGVNNIYKTTFQNMMIIFLRGNFSVYPLLDQCCFSGIF